MYESANLTLINLIEQEYIKLAVDINFPLNILWFLLQKFLENSISKNNQWWPYLNLYICEQSLLSYYTVLGIYLLTTFNPQLLAASYHSFFKLLIPILAVVSINRSSWSYKPMTTLCQMEIFNFLWLKWVQYLPLAPT